MLSDAEYEQLYCNEIEERIKTKWLYIIKYNGRVIRLGNKTSFSTEASAKGYVTSYISHDFVKKLRENDDYKHKVSSISKKQLDKIAKQVQTNLIQKGIIEICQI